MSDMVVFALCMLVSGVVGYMIGYICGNDDAAI